MPADINTWNDRIIAEFRANVGRVAWSDDEDLARGCPVPPRLPGFAADAGAPIILVHHTGAHRPRPAALNVYEHRLRGTLSAQADQLRAQLNSEMIELP